MTNAVVAEEGLVENRSTGCPPRTIAEGVVAKLTNLDEVVDAIKKGANPHVSVRTLLEWFSAERRGSRVVAWIDAELANRKLTTEPSYEHAHIDEHVTFKLIAAGPTEEPKGRVPTGTVMPAAPVPAPELHRHAQRVRSVPSARRAVETVAPDTPVQKALSILLGRGISQLAVITGKHTLRGIFSWSSHGAAVTLGRTPKFVQDAMDAPRTVTPDADLFLVARDVAAHGAVLVVDKDHSLLGVVTAADISRYVSDLAEPFALVGEVEGHLRTLRRRLRGSPDGGEDETLAQQHAWFVSNWDELGIAIDRDFFLGELDEVRKIRNDIAHFSPDPLDEQRLRRLRDLARLLARLAEG